MVKLNILSQEKQILGIVNLYHLSRYSLKQPRTQGIRGRFRALLHLLYCSVKEKRKRTKFALGRRLCLKISFEIIPIKFSGLLDLISE